MNEFVEQFLIECRELIEQATDDLLTLEGRPDDAERLDGAFRAFHTLKGAAGIVDFDAMGRALHAAEEVLSSLRAGAEPVTPELISDCLTCLDQVVQWLDAMQADGEIPAGADAAAEAVIQRFRRAGPAAVATPRAPAAWRDALIARHPEAAAAIVLRYAPGPDAFLRGQDPLALLAGVPDLRVLEIEDGPAWPPLEALDPFACRLVFLALAGCSAEQARAALGAAPGEVEILALGAAAPEAASGLSATARAVIEAQLLLLENAEAEGLAGRMGSAGGAVANILRWAGRPAAAAGVERALAQSQAAGGPQSLSVAVGRVLAGEAIEDAAPAGPQPAERTPAEAAARTLRVDVERIDALVNLTGELLVAKNALGHAVSQAQGRLDTAALAALLKDQHAVLHRLVDDLQRSVLSIRVLQMRQVFQRFPRLVREMVVTLGKPAHLVTEGDETEADKTIVESLFEPLLHVLRNALDHGVESPAARAAAGKPPAATITLRARRLNDNVIVEVEDDGAGVDLARVRAVAAQRGVASPEALAAMSDPEVVDLVFAAGFSTATQVTSLSGRGVGMDAVRAAAERLGGRVTMESRAGAGATVRFILPFAVLMSRILTVEAGGQLFGIPLEAVLETVRVARGDIKPVGASRAFVLRHRTVPVIDLGQTLGARPDPAATDEANIVVVSAGGHLGGLEVDRLGARLDVMLKPMEGLLSGLAGIAGTTLLGDGRVLLVLDLQELLG
ncbi:chemotaxis protein CheA [Phenylobacterium sp.]|uniref:chemotaxis protein CheA n=1 Tax=Phenylobacterium sp. TaxID=1871053 RepID=UPI0025F1E7AC|nr:chemotaxis protein CheA [Phenylobacterium sp.]